MLAGIVRERLPGVSQDFDGLPGWGVPIHEQLRRLLVLTRHQLGRFPCKTQNLLCPELRTENIITIAVCPKMTSPATPKLSRAKAQWPQLFTII
jgi:hypothetical protein